MSKRDKEVSMKVLNGKTAAAAVIILFALFLLTCELGPPESSESGEDVEWLDWNFVTNPDGSGKLTLMLDGTTPFAYKKQQRALSEDLAKMSHDFFEVIFLAGAVITTPTTPALPEVANPRVTGGVSIARASWEIGQPAGISGVRRGVDYKNVYPAAAPDNDASVIFVGKKTGKTLLGIGHLIEVREGNANPPITTPTATTITQAATSVTFGVYPMKTRIGFNEKPYPIPEPPALPPDPPFPPNPGNVYQDVDTLATFLTAATSQNATGDPLTGAAVNLTTGKNVTLRGGVEFPLFTLPDAIDKRKIEASYRIGGMTAAGGINLFESARVMGTYLTGGGKEIGVEIIKRTPSYVVGGQTFDATGAIDMLTTVTPRTHGYTDYHNAFTEIIVMDFTQVKDADGESAGIFAITFQCPVYAITTAASTNSGPSADKWYIRPGYQQYQYLLDNGKDAGGMVMLGTNAGDIDWLDIFTIGMGFSN
jgi:hypothetical protein